MADPEPPMDIRVLRAPTVYVVGRQTITRRSWTGSSPTTA